MTDKANLSSSTSLRTVTLDFPLKIGNDTIESVQVRKPVTGEFRGTNMMALSQLDYAAIETVLPRITTPVLTKYDIGNLDPADFMQFCGEIMDFLLPKSAKVSGSPTT